MKDDRLGEVLAALRLLYKPHPWHGIEIGEDAPALVTAYIEIVPTDTVKYEIDKTSGYLKVDRPQKYSNLCPTLYGFLPQTYCGNEIGAFCARQTNRTAIIGDGDPLDICVLSEKSLTHGDTIVRARPIGGLRMIDKNEADDKIIAVLEGDAVYGEWHEIGDVAPSLIDRLRHYFLTYKQVPGEAASPVEITDVYARREAYEVIRHSQTDYAARFGAARDLLAQMTTASR